MTTACTPLASRIRHLTPACAFALALSGCAGGPGHERDRLSVGLSLFSVPLVSVVELRHEAMSDAAAATGDRLSIESGPSPFSFLGLGRGVHLIEVNPAQATPEPVPADEGAAPGAEAEAGAPDPQGAHREDSRGRR